MEELKAPTFVKSDHPIQVYWADTGQTIETNNKRNTGSTKDNVPKFKDWEHKFEVKEYLEKCKVYKEGLELGQRTKANVTT